MIRRAATAAALRPQGVESAIAEALRPQEYLVAIPQEVASVVPSWNTAVAASGKRQ